MWGGGGRGRARVWSQGLPVARTTGKAGKSVGRQAGRSRQEAKFGYVQSRENLSHGSDVPDRSGLGIWDSAAREQV